MTKSKDIKIIDLHGKEQTFLNISLEEFEGIKEETKAFENYVRLMEKAYKLNRNDENETLFKSALTALKYIKYTNNEIEKQF
jgi:hypothetical protein